MALPPFDADGLLPPGDYPMTFEELRKSHLVRRSLTSGDGWDEAWRLRLVDNLEVLVRQLWAVGIANVFIDGSFVEDKDHPNDIDGYFECDVMHLATGDLVRQLNALDQHKVWTWDPKSRKPSTISAKKQLPMWHRYQIELYPHYGQNSGIKDPFGNELQFPSAFRLSRRSQHQKGIIKILESEHVHDQDRERISGMPQTS